MRRGRRDSLSAETTTLRIDFVSESAGYRNGFGWYNARTGQGGTLFGNIEAEGAGAPLAAGCRLQGPDSFGGNGRAPIASRSSTASLGLAPETYAAAARTTTMANQAPTFFTGGGPVATAGLGSAESVTIQPDGKMLVAGTGGGGFALARYNDDGSLDTTTFGGGDVGIVTTAFTGDPAGRSVALQSDGKILVAGEGDDAFALVRYNADGSLDTTTFGGGDGIVTTRFTTATGPIDAGGHSVAVQPDGNIVVVGYSQVGSTITTISLARYKGDDGTPDTTFDGDGQVREVEGFTSDIFVPAQSVLSDVTILSDGRILAAGTVTRLDAPFDDYFALVRYNPNGSRDLSFGGGDGIVIRSVGDDGAANAMAVQADGKIILAGYGGGLLSSDFVLFALNADGIVDTTFDGNGRVTTGFGSGNEQAHSVTLQPDGKILVAGESGGVFALARYNAADGSLDTTFDGDGKVTTAIGTSSGGHSVTVLSDGKILVAGSSSEGGFTLVRYNSDGSLDYTFGGTNTLDGAPTYIENGAPITIDGSIFVYDPELGELNAGNGDYGGASLTLARQGGANAQDVFGAGLDCCRFFRLRRRSLRRKHRHADASGRHAHHRVCGLGDAARAQCCTAVR